jgi:hypothetical protein
LPFASQSRVLLMVCLLAAMLRAWSLNECLWLDELHSAWCISGDWPDVAPRARIGNQSPLYFYLPKITATLCGPAEWSIRLPSLVAGLMLLPVVAGLIGRWSGSTSAGWCAALLIAIDRNMIFYAQEARPYALVQLLAWCHLGITWRLAQSPTIWTRIAFVVGAIAMFHTHYTSALFLAGEFTFLLIHSLAGSRSNAAGDNDGNTTSGASRTAETPRYRVSQLAVDSLLIALAVAPALSHLEHIAQHRAAWRPFEAKKTLDGLIRLYRLDVYVFPTIVALAIARLGRHRWNLTRAIDSRGVAATISVLVVATAIAWLASTFDAAYLFQRRYLAASLAAPIALSVLAAWTVPHRWLRGAAIAAIVAVSLATSGMSPSLLAGGRLIPDRSQDWRGAVRYVNENSHEGRATALVRSGLIEADRLRQPHDGLLEEYCLSPVTSLYPLRIPAQALPTTDASRLDTVSAEVLATLDTVWMIFNGSPDARREFESDVRLRWSSQFQLVDRREFGEILVLKGQRSVDSRQSTVNG